ncbi:MAG: hypothetical protein V8S36_09465 [Lachnospiraceae bacterium]
MAGQWRHLRKDGEARINIACPRATLQEAFDRLAEALNIMPASSAGIFYVDGVTYDGEVRLQGQ